MTDARETLLLIGLGNPGKKYDKTRHNIGFRVLKALAEEKKGVFKSKREFRGELAVISWDVHRVLLLLPLTYMNLSGISVRSVVHFYHLMIENLLVITDDADLPFGEVRYRSKGSSGGHNGLKSVEEELRTKEYARVKVGIGKPEIGDLSSYVLRPFLLEEEEKLSEVISRAVLLITHWLDGKKTLPI